MYKEVKEVKTYATVYVAEDGTEFDAEKECRDYEATCQNVLSSRAYESRVKKDLPAETFRDISGSDYSYDDRFDIFEPKTKDDIENINRYLVYKGLGVCLTELHIGLRVAIDRYDTDIWYLGTKEEMLAKYKEALDWLFDDEKKEEE